MNVIPVIDILNGRVVRAVRGDRKSYQPIQSALCHSSDPLAVARILCRHCATNRLYVADLDALQGGVSQIATLHALLDAEPQLELWLDAGFADLTVADAVLQALSPHQGRVVPVFASETLRSPAALAECFEGGRRQSAILSLDRRDGRKLDVAGCWEAPGLWPQRVIVMTLERVGADSGPDLQTLADVRRRAPQATLIGAGGIRNAADLSTADAAGADAWLVASALHDLRLAPTSAPAVACAPRR